jgi:HD-like signal output (HDOD) protein/ActR/RegA family two-component response regulator
MENENNKGNVKKRILFVDDNSVLLHAYTMMLDAQEWDTATASTGEEALEVVKSGDFDVVVTDLRMPGMSGIDLIEEVIKIRPCASRVIISGLENQEEVARCLNSTHQFLPKPFTAKALKATLGRLGGVESYLRDPKLQALFGRLGRVPSFPTLYVEIIKELALDEPSVEKVSSTISRDPGMTAKMLQIVNSAAVGLAQRTNSTSEAVQFLGLNAVRSLVLSAHIFSCFDRFKLKWFSSTALSRHSLNCGMLSRRIMQLAGASDEEAEAAFVSGMLHDLGKLMLAHSLPQQYQAIVVEMKEHQVSAPVAERQILGATHSGIAAYLLALWGLPTEIVEAVAFHHTPSASSQQEFSALTAVHVANTLEHEILIDDPSLPMPPLDMDYLCRVDCVSELGRWREVAENLLLRAEAV